MRKAFTLVELLVVIAIIGILATLVTVAAVASRQYVKVGVVKMEMSQIEMAIERYKNEFGEYPPDFSDSNAVVRHIKKRWPRFQFDPAKVLDIIDNVYKGSSLTGIDYTDISGCRVGTLAFWLGGFPDNGGKFRGFDADPTAPFGKDSSNNNSNNGILPVTAANVKLVTRDNKTFMDLTIDENVRAVEYVSGRRVFILVQNAGSGRFVPYVYFRGTSEGATSAYYEATPPTNIKSINFMNYTDTEWKELGVAVPYGRAGIYDADFADNTVVWNNPTTYQLIHPGLDGKFGNTGTPFYRSLNVGDAANQLGPQDMDNIVNFGDGATIKSLLP